MFHKRFYDMDMNETRPIVQRCQVNFLVTNNSYGPTKQMHQTHQGKSPSMMQSKPTTDRPGPTECTIVASTHILTDAHVLPPFNKKPKFREISRLSLKFGFYKTKEVHLMCPTYIQPSAHDACFCSLCILFRLDF